MKKIVAGLIIITLAAITLGCGGKREVYDPEMKDPKQQYKDGKQMMDEVGE
ncbi:MAG: hypothetical protein ACLFUS_04205 [Candidatus Sumerlaeia bacterium]